MVRRGRGQEVSDMLRTVGGHFLDDVRKQNGAAKGDGGAGSKDRQQVDGSEAGISTVDKHAH